MGGSYVTRPATLFDHLRRSAHMRRLHVGYCAHGPRRYTNSRRWSCPFFVCLQRVQRTQCRAFPLRAYPPLAGLRKEIKYQIHAGGEKPTRMVGTIFGYGRLPFLAGVPAGVPAGTSAASGASVVSGTSAGASGVSAGASAASGVSGLSGAISVILKRLF